MINIFCRSSQNIFVLFLSSTQKDGGVPYFSLLGHMQNSLLRKEMLRDDTYLIVWFSSLLDGN